MSDEETTVKDSASILKSVKKLLNIFPDDDSFDLEILIHINSAFSTLQQLGVGPDSGFEIEDDTVVWNDYLGDESKFNSVKTYVYISVRLVFDPPGSSYGITALEKKMKEYEWRFQVAAEKPLSFVDNSDAFWWVLPVSGEFPEEAEVNDLGYSPATGKVWRKL